MLKSECKTGMKYKFIRGIVVINYNSAVVKRLKNWLER